MSQLYIAITLIIKNGLASVRGLAQAQRALVLHIIIANRAQLVP